jgi:hypothetical protein
MNHELVKMAFSRYYRTELFTLEEAIKFLWDRNLINVGELAEKAIVRTGKKKQTKRNNPECDFDDNSDSKYVTVSHYQTKSGSITSYACVAGIKNKKGTLRVMVHEPKTQLNYYFRIPYKVYAPYTGADDSLKIWFNNDGSPREPKRIDIRYNLWDHECSSKEWAQ